MIGGILLKNKKITTTLSVIVLLIICLPFSPLVRNNILLGKYAAQLYAVPLPSDTIQISQDKAVGNLYGTGNHLDFVATIEVESSLSEAELSAYYSSVGENIKSADEISILGLNTFYSETHIDHSTQKIEVIPKVQARHVVGLSKVFCKVDNVDLNVDKNLFIIQIKDTHYAPGWDIRAH